MTICIAAHFGEFVIFVADTRTSLGRPAISHTDGNKKINETNIGLITGSGWVDLLDLVRRELSDKKIEHTSQILEIIQDKVAEARQNHLHIEEEIIESTGWLYTYKTIVDTEECLRLNYYHGSSTQGQMQIPPNSGCVWIDAEYIDDASIQYSKYLDGQIKLLSEIDDYSERLKMFFELCIAIVSHTSFYYDSISPEFYLGMHTIEGDKSITGPFSVVSKADHTIAGYLNFQEER